MTDLDEKALAAAIATWPKTWEVYRLGEAIAKAIAAYFAAVPSTAVEALPDDIRAQGWAVAVHNDYRQHGEPHTFWLFTKGERAIKGEGRSDAEALNQVRASLASGAKPVAEEPAEPFDTWTVEQIADECERLKKVRDNTNRLIAKMSARLPSPDVAGLEPVAWRWRWKEQRANNPWHYTDSLPWQGESPYENEPLYSASQLSALEVELREAQDRIDELESEADNVAVDFELEITGAVWALLRRLDADLSDGMNAGQAVEWLDLHIRELTGRAETAERQLAAEKGP